MLTRRGHLERKVIVLKTDYSLIAVFSEITNYFVSKSLLLNPYILILSYVSPFIGFHDN